MQDYKKDRNARIIKLNDLYELIDYLKLKNKYDQSDISYIFDEIDLFKTGEVNFNQFINIAIEKTRTNSSPYTEFYLSTINFYLTPSEIIGETIKKAINKFKRYEEHMIIKELEWVLQTLSEKDLFDFRLKDDFITKDDDQNDYMNFLCEYSQNSSKRRETQDLELFNSKSVKKKIMQEKRKSSLSLEGLHICNTYNMINIDTLSCIDDYDFNIFRFTEEVGKEMSMVAIGTYIFTKYDLFDCIHSQNFDKFLNRVRLGYNNVPYHNHLHASDVLQTCYHIMKKGNIYEKIDLSQLELSSFLISILVHDIGHSGLTNSYHVNKKSKIALRYNDKSVLENFHCYEAFKILNIPSCNILEGLENEEIRIFRKRMIDSILSTDMSYHTKVYTTIKLRIDTVYQFENNKCKINALIESEDKLVKFEKQQDLLNYLIHISDISNPAKPFDIYNIWTDLILSEFFNQGDLEKSEGLAISFLCDRNTTNKPKSQITFINSIVFPLFSILVFIIPEAKHFEENLLRNIEIWRKQIEF